MNGTLELLVFVSLPMGVLFLVFFIRAVRSGQYEDQVTPAMRILAEDETPKKNGHEKHEKAQKTE